MRFIHVKTGNEYSFMHVGIDEATLEPNVSYAEVRGNHIFTRSAKEFFDGRFVLVEKHEADLKAEADLRQKALTAPSRAPRKGR